MYYKYLRVNIIRDSSCIDSTGWIKKKKLTKKSEKSRRFQCAATLALNYEKNDSNLERVSSDRGFINRYNWKGINYQTKTIAHNVLHTKEKEISPTYISKVISNFKK